MTAKYTISFVDAAGEHYVVAHKTLSEILSHLRDLGYVLTDGAEGALGAMVQAYKERGTIEDNEDMDYIAFFTDKDNKIIASNIQINKPNITELVDALTFLEECKQYYGNRLDLLSHLDSMGNGCSHCLHAKDKQLLFEVVTLLRFPECNQVQYWQNYSGN